METKRIITQLILGLLTATIIVALAAILTPDGNLTFYLITIPTMIGYMVYCMIIERKVRKPVDSNFHSHKRDIMHPNAIRRLPIDSTDAIDANNRNIMAAMELDLELEQEFYDDIATFYIPNKVNTKIVPVKDINGDNLTAQHYIIPDDFDHLQGDDYIIEGNVVQLTNKDINIAKRIAYRSCC